MGKITQKHLILNWIDLHGYIVPAKMSGKVFEGTMFGSETSRRCREMRKAGILGNDGAGKFARFWRTSNPYKKQGMDFHAPDIFEAIGRPDLKDNQLSMRFFI